MTPVTPHPRSTALAVALAALILAAFAAPAPAHQLSPYAFSSSFDGSGSTAGAFSTSVGPLSIDQSTGRVYVIDVAIATDKAAIHDWISQFDAGGAPVPFSGLAGASSIDTGRVVSSSGYQLPFDIAVDNHPGSVGIYALNAGANGVGGPLRSYGFDGIERPGFPVDTNGGEALAVDPEGFPWVNDAQYSPSGAFVDNLLSIGFANVSAIAFDSAGDFYVARPNFFDLLGNGLYKYDPQGNFLAKIDRGFFSAVAVDPSDDHVFTVGESGTTFVVTEYSPQGVPLQSFGSSLIGNSQGVAVNATTHAVYVSDRQHSRVAVFSPQAPIVVPDATTGSADPSPDSATLHGTINADNVPTTDCRFEWGALAGSYPNSTPCAEGAVFSGSADSPASGTVTGLELGHTYHYRLKAKNANKANGADAYSFGADRTFQAQGPPSGSGEFATDVNNDGVRLHAAIDPNGGDTTYHFEYLTNADFTANGGFAGAAVFPPSDASLADNLGVQGVSQEIAGLRPDTTYHYRVIASNANSTAPGPDRTFKTFPLEPSSDPCPNAHVRQQTGTRLLLDCRAYELASAPDTGGYDVESDLLPGQAPLIGSPQATGRLLYALHYGAIPGVGGSPTNFGRDPYLASRGEHGWTTQYVGLPADGMAEQSPFASPILGSDASLDTFAFGGSDICAPCFPDGSTNVPLRSAGGPVVKGMAGTLEPAANPAGVIAKPLSADGAHFVFGATVPFEQGAGPGDLTIYDRDLKAGTTQIASTLPGGSPIGGAANAELDISDDGSRIVIGHLLSTDAAGNRRYQLYLHIGASPSSVDLTPGATRGALFAGMSSDGSRVFFATTDRLLPAQDTDAGVDLYEADVGPAGELGLRLVSVTQGGPSNDDSCRPDGTLDAPAWNKPSASEGGDCSAVSFAGGAGVSAAGALYFLSPECLDSEGGVKNQPNLYFLAPGAASPSFVATVDSSLVKPPKPPPTHPPAAGAFAIGLTQAAGLGVDDTGAVYVLNNGKNQVRKLSASGAAQNFTAGGNSGTNILTGKDAPTGVFSEEAATPVQLAVDRANGYLYVPDYKHGVVDKFATTGQYLSQLSVTKPTGVAVRPSNGDLYVASAAGGVSVFDSAGGPQASLPITATAIAVDAGGTIYGVAAGIANVYDGAGGFLRQLDPNAAKNVAVDTSGAYPHDGEVYVDEGTSVAVFDASGNPVTSFTSTELSGSTGIAVGPDHHVFANRVGGARVLEFGFSDPPYPAIDDPAVLHAVAQAETHDYADFQVSPDGRFALFASRLPLTGYDGSGHSELYRYDAHGPALECVSCNPSGAVTVSETTLTRYGLNLVDDGRVFFTTPEQLVLRDTNHRKDAYEWEDGDVQLISTGTSPTDSSLLSASADGTDAFFFTRETLTFDDRNGARVKVYDARAGGGFEFVPAAQPCAASDECHGAGTQAPPEPVIPTLTGRGSGSGTRPRTGCKRGFVKRHGRCVRRHRAPRHRRGSK